MPSTFFPFAVDGGDNHFCLNAEDNCIYFVPLDMGENPKLRKVSDKPFPEFIESLVSEDDADF